MQQNLDEFLANEQLVSERDFHDWQGEREIASSWPGRREQLIELANRCSGLILEFSSRFCMIEVFSSSGQCVNRHGGGADRTVRSKCRSLFVQHWPKLIFLINLYCMLKLIVNIWFQYEYDHCLLKLKWILARPQEQSIDMRADHMGQPSIDQLRHKCNSTRATLKSIGAPHLGATIAIECVYITILMMVGASYILGQLYFRYVQNFDLYLVRAILDRKRELHNCRRVIIDQVNKFIISHRNFLLFDISSRNTSMSTGSAATKKKKTNNLIDAHMLRFKQELLVKQFKLMVKSGALIPLNWTGKWLDLISVAYCLFNCACLAWGIFFDIAFYQLMPRYANFRIESEPLDLLFNFDLVLISAIASTALIFYLTTCVISCLDQARLIRCLHQLVLDCMRENWRLYRAGEPVGDFRFRELLVVQEQLEQQYKFARINRNILLVIVHYRVLIVQLRPILKCAAFVSFVSIFMILAHPVMIRLHTPYVESLDLKSRYYIISLIAAFFVNLNLLPVCYINSRSVDLYAALHCLLAHTIHLAEMEQLTGSEGRDRQETGSERVPLYDPHSIWVLRRELKSATLFVRKFETRTFGLTFTFSYLMRLYFWLGFLSLAILSTDPQDYPSTGNAGLSDQQQQQQQQQQRLSSNMFNDFLRDPFNFYTWP